jgi:cyanophycin synthetase
LIERENQNPLRGEGHEKPLTRIVVDPIMQAYLRRRHLCLESVPAPGTVVVLRETANLSTGGTATDVTDQVHPDIEQMCERAAQVIGLDICGIDLIAPDIAAPLHGRGGIIEVNAGPGIRMHHFPTQGHSRDVGAAILDMLYPANTPGRIPIFSITGTNGKTTVTRMISHILAATGQTVGMTTTDGIWIGGACIAKGDTSGPQSARAVLSDPTVDVAVLETARGGITRRGLGYDWADIAILTNIHEDHIGQDGITSIEDLVHIKSLVAERVREGGTLILNADNEATARLMDLPRVRKTPKQVIYFSLHDHHLLIRRHVTTGGIAYTVKNGWIVEAIGTAEEPLIEAATIPVTLQGAAEFNVANALAAVAACRAYGIPRETIKGALQTFGGIANNAGRGNLYKVGKGYVLVDYGHNADAFAALGRLTTRLTGYRVTAVLDVPGDRADWVIAKAGSAAARAFTRVIIREPQNRRGRQEGEAEYLLARAIREEVPACDCRVILNEREAVETALREVQEGDLVILFYDDLDWMLDILHQYGATPAAMLPARESQPQASYGTQTAMRLSFT